MSIFFVVGCPANFKSYSDSCYGFPADLKDWFNARRYCQRVNDGYDLVVVHDRAKHNFLVGEILKLDYNITNFWMGLRETGPENKYVWVDRKYLGFTQFGHVLGRDPWKQNEPNEVVNLIKLFP